MVVEKGSRQQRGFLFNHTTHFSKGLEKSKCDFTGTIFIQCENPVLTVKAIRRALFVVQTRKKYYLREKPTQFPVGKLQIII